MTPPAVVNPIPLPPLPIPPTNPTPITPPAVPMPPVQYYDLPFAYLSGELPTTPAGTQASNLLVRADQAAEWVQRLSAPGMEITTVAYMPGSDYVRLVLPDTARNPAAHDRIRAAFIAAGVPGVDAMSELQQSLNCLYRGDIYNPTGCLDRFLVINRADGLARVYGEPIAAVVPSSLLVRADQALDWAKRLSAPGAQVTIAPGPAGTDYVRLVLPDSQRNGPAHDRLRDQFIAAGLNATRPGGDLEMQQALNALYRGDTTLNPQGHPDRYVVLDPDTGVAYLSDTADFGVSQLSGSLSKVSPDTLNALVSEGRAQSVDGYVYFAWVDPSSGRSHRLVFEPYRTESRSYPSEIPIDYEVEVSAIGKAPQAGDYYKLVLHFNVPLGTSRVADVSANITSPTAARAAVDLVIARKEGRAADADVANATMALNGIQFAARVAPIWGTIIYAVEGETREAVISAAGDATLFFGIGVWVKGAQAGRAARMGLALSAGVDASIAVYRAGQGVDAVIAGDDWTAAAKFGDAALRLVGVGVNTAAYLKAAARARVAIAEGKAAANLTAEKLAAEVQARATAQALEAADGGHSLARHGPELADDILLRRVTTGIAPDGVFSPQQFSTRFNDYETWLKVRNDALKALQADPAFKAVPGPGDLRKLDVTINYSEPIGSGFRGREGMQTTITVNGKTGKVYTEADPISVYRVTTVIAWDTTSGSWKVVQMFPNSAK